MYFFLSKSCKPLPALATIDLFSIRIVSPFPEYYMHGVIVFWAGLLLASKMNLRFFGVSFINIMETHFPTNFQERKKSKLLEMWYIYQKKMEPDT